MRRTNVVKLAVDEAVNHKLMIRPEGTLALFRAGRRSEFLKKYLSFQIPF